MEEYVYIERRKTAESVRCSWAIGGKDVAAHPPLFTTFQRMAGPFASLVDCDRWIETEGVRHSGGKRRNEGEWFC